MLPDAYPKDRLINKYAYAFQLGLPSLALLESRTRAYGGGLIDFDDVSDVVVDWFWSGYRGQFSICRLFHKSDTQRQHWQGSVGLLCPVSFLLCVFAAGLR